MQVLRRICAFRYGVNIYIEDAIGGYRRYERTGFLDRLADRGPQRCFSGFAVTTRLQPFIELAVMHEQRHRGRRIDYKSGAGNVAGEAAALEGVFVCSQEVQESIDDC